MKITAACAAIGWMVIAAGCSSSGSGTPGTGGGAGSGGTGVGGGSGGSGNGGSGGGSGSGGHAGTSPGTVTLEFQVPSTTSYCDQAECGPMGHIAIKDSSGNAILLSPGDCYMACESCQSLPCPGYACMQQGFPVTGQTINWDGTYFASGTCGANVQCYAQKYMPAGSYTAVMCATPGTLSDNDSGVKTCTATGTPQCVEVPFQFPSADPVIGTLPG